MITSIINKTKKFSTLVAVATGLALTGGSVTAFATLPAGGGQSTPRTPFEVNVFPGGMSIFLLDDPNAYVVYSGTPPESNCATWAQPADLVKSYTALAQSAILSGKTIRISFNTCPAVVHTPPQAGDHPASAQISGVELFQ